MSCIVLSTPMSKVTGVYDHVSDIASSQSCNRDEKGRMKTLQRNDRQESIHKLCMSSHSLHLKRPARKLMRNIIPCVDVSSLSTLPSPDPSLRSVAGQ